MASRSLLLFMLPIAPGWASAATWSVAADSAVPLYQSIEATYVRVYRDGGNRLLATHLSDQAFTLVGDRLTGPVVRFLEDGSVDPAFTLDARIAEAWALDFDNSGRAVVGAGLFSEQLMDGFPAYRVVRLLESGELDPDFMSPPLAHLPRFVRVQPDGRILVGSGMSAQIPARDGILDALSPIRLNPDGSIDASFHRPVFDPGSSGLGATFEVDSAGRIYIGGSFNEVNGIPWVNLVRLLPDGEVDPDWQPQSEILLNSNSGVRDIHLLGDGTVLLAGSFRDPVTRSRYLFARLDASGQVSQIVESPEWSLSAREMRVAADGSIYLATDRRLTRIGQDGTIDMEFGGVLSDSEGTFHLEILVDGSLVVPLSGTLKRVSPTGELSDFSRQTLLSMQAYPEVTLLPEAGFLVAGEVDRMGGVEARVALFDWDLKPVESLTAEELGGERTRSDGSSFQGLGRVNLLRREADGGVTASIGVADGRGVYSWPFVTNALFVSPEGQFLIDRETKPVSGFRLQDGRLIEVSTPLFSSAFTPELEDPVKTIYVVGEAIAYQLVPQREYSVEAGEPVITTRELEPLWEWNGRVLFGFGEQLIFADSTDFSKAAGIQPIALKATDVSFKLYRSLAVWISGPETYARVERRVRSAAVGAFQLSTGYLLVWGNFNEADNRAVPGLLKLGPGGYPDFSFSDSVGAGPRTEDGSFGRIEDVVEDAFGWIHVVGRFTRFSGMAAPGYVILHPDGSPVAVPDNLGLRARGLDAWRPEFSDPRARVFPIDETSILLAGPYVSSEGSTAALHRLERERFADPFAASLMVTDAWARSPWYGWHTPLVDGLLFHPVHGYQYVFPAGSAAFWAYDVNMGNYLYFSRHSYPWIYYEGSPSGYLYFLDYSRIGERWFADFRTGPWQYVREDAL